MTQGPQSITLQVTPQFAAQVPMEPQPNPQIAELSALAGTSEKRDQLACQRLLVGKTRQVAEGEAAEVLSKILSNTQVLAVFGTDALEAVNRLNDRMLNERPPVDIPELREAMKSLSRNMRGIGKKYDPNDPSVLKKYEKVKGGLFVRFGIVKSFLEEFLDDIRSLQQQFERAVRTLEGKQYQLLKNVAYYDEFYRLNEQEIDKLIYKIGVMEIIRDMLAEQASHIFVGNSNMGDRGSEQQAQILELVTLLENKIIAFKSRLWVAWAMAPQIRTMRAISIGLSARIDQTVDITIPTMKSTIVVWLTLNEAQQSEQFNKAAEDTYNEVMRLFANAAKATVPALASSLAAPALDPRTVLAWSESLSAQADGIVQAIESGHQKRAELEQAMIAGKQIIDASTQRVNQAQLERLLTTAQENQLEIAHSVSDQS
jgi:uncharacterized protein YaaN involved in tellurite resistance